MNSALSGLLIGFAAAASLPLFAASKEPNLIAQWSFRKDLRADWGGFEFAEMDWGNDAQMVQDEGLVHLGRGRLLITHEINSRELSNLKDAVTLWARMRINETPSTPCFLMGLRNHSEPADWENMSLALFADPLNDGSVGFYATLSNGQLFASGPSSLAPVKPGVFFTVALIFDRASGSRETFINGRLVSRETKHPMRNLNEFTNLTLGRLMTHSALAMTFDEVRLYGSALDLGEIAKLETEARE